MPQKFFHKEYQSSILIHQLTYYSLSREILQNQKLATLKNLVYKIKMGNFPLI